MLGNGHLLKNFITEDDWSDMKEYISYDFQKDSHFVEMKDSEILRERINTLNEMDQFVGKYYSQRWIRKNVLRQSEKEIEDMSKELEDEGGDEGEEDDEY